jgi:GntR family transcriptional repressor for pyruvate dehydrogenase complex
LSRISVMTSDWTPLPQVVARRLQQMILDGELKSGDQIPSQRILSGQFNVSRASLREALLTLETLGLIKTEPGRGTFVTAGQTQEPGSELKWRYSDSFSMQDVFETRLMLEGQIVESAVPLMDTTVLSVLRDATDEMERCWDSGDLLANVEADLLFHWTIAQACPNQMLRTLYETVRGLVTETQRQPIPRTNPNRMRASLAEHRQIIDAISRADAPAACAAMQSHVRNTAECAGIVI